MKERYEEKVKQQLDSICKSNGWDAVREVETLNGKPVYLLTRSTIPKGAKTGFPHLFSINDTMDVYELTAEQTHTLMVSRNRQKRSNELWPN